jgi:hypothetical protein
MDRGHFISWKEAENTTLTEASGRFEQKKQERGPAIHLPGQRLETHSSLEMISRFDPGEGYRGILGQTA